MVRPEIFAILLTGRDPSFSISLTIANFSSIRPSATPSAFGTYSLFIHQFLYDIAHIAPPFHVSLVILHRPSQKILNHIFRLCTPEIMHQLLHLITS